MGCAAGLRTVHRFASYCLLEVAQVFGLVDVPSFIGELLVSSLWAARLRPPDAAVGIAVGAEPGCGLGWAHAEVMDRGQRSGRSLGEGYG